MQEFEVLEILKENHVVTKNCCFKKGFGKYDKTSWYFVCQINNGIPVAARCFENLETGKCFIEVLHFRTAGLRLVRDFINFSDIETLAVLVPRINY